MSTRGVTDYALSSSINCSLVFSDIRFQTSRGGGENLLCGTAKGHLGIGVRFMTVEEEIEMLEGAKEHLETQIKNIETRLQKLKA